MKRHAFTGWMCVLLLAGAASAQDYSRLENLADELRNQAEDLVEKTAQRLDGGNLNTRPEIERAFLAEQFLASAKFIEKLIDDKFFADDLRQAGRVLADMAGRFAELGADDADWKQARDKVNELNFELRNPNSDPVEEVAGPPGENEILGKVFWVGQVDHEVHLEIRGASIRTKTKVGQVYPAGTHSFTSALPRREGLQVGVTKNDGRGEVRVLQQPNRGNDYTAVIQILDAGGGARKYSVEIYWQ